MLSVDYDPQSWAPQHEAGFSETLVGQELIPLFERVSELTAEPYDPEAHDRLSHSLDRLAKPGRLLTPEEEFVASRMNYVARLKVESWTGTVKTR